MKLYKGFNQDMTCRGFQFEEGKTYTEDKAELCQSGFHACENPLECFSYYYPDKSVYHEVELEDVSDEKEDDSTKRCGKTIKIGARLDVAGICKAHFEYVEAKTTNGDSALSFSALSAQNNSALSARNYSALSALDRSSLSAGKNSVIAAFNSRAKGGLNTLIALAVRDGNGKIVDFAAGIVDGVNIKADIWYEVKDGKFVEVWEEQDNE